MTADSTPTSTAGSPQPLRSGLTLPSVVLGLGLGGFVDGILLHQVAQWHHMATSLDSYPASTLSGLEANAVLDGLFHLVTWLIVIVGVTLTVRQWRRAETAPVWTAHAGSLLFGWGIFNLVEGLVDHHLLGIHHVRDDLGAPVEWDVAFLVLGAILAAAGVALARRRPSGGAVEGRS